MSRLIETGRTARRGGLARRTLGLAALTGAVLLSALAPAAHAGLTERVSVSSAGAEANTDSVSPAISADGRYVSFSSYASNLVAGDTNGTRDVFLRDRLSGETSQVGGGSLDDPAISADGRYVSFKNFREDIVVRDLQTGETEVVSVSSAGVEANSYSYGSSISADGRYVSFASRAWNLVANDSNGKPDVFVHDRQNGETRRVSVSSAGAQANDSSGGSLFSGRISPMSADGRYIAFNSAASNLVPNDTNNSEDVFVHDLNSGETRRVSVTGTGAEAQGGSRDPSISADGRYVSFTSTALNLGPPRDIDFAFPTIFVHDRQSGVTQRVSASPAGKQANGTSDASAISADGRYVAFRSLASNLVSGDTNGTHDVFVYDRQSGVMRRVSVSGAGAQANGSSGGYPYKAHISPISADGRYIAFSSQASNLVPGDTNGTYDVFVHDLGVRETTPPDTTAPRLDLPESIVRDATSTTGADVSYPASATDERDGAVPVTCTPSSGTTFPIGATTVHCTAIDKAGNTANGSFTVTVSTPRPSPNLISNDGFETDLAGWNRSGSAAGVTLSREAGGHSGSWTARLTNTGTSAGTCTLNDAPNAVASTESGGYTARLWVRADSAGQTLKLRLREYSGSTPVGSATSQVVLTTAWQPVTVGYAPKAPGASTLDLNAYVIGAAPGTCFDADDASIALDPPPPPPQLNLVANPGFETDLAGWNTSGSAAGVTLTREAGGHSGGWAARLTNTGTSAGSCTLNDAPKVATTTASGGHTARLWVRADAPGQTLKLRLREYSTGALVGTWIREFMLTTAWQQVSVGYTPASPGDSTLDLNAYVTGAPPGTCFLVDDVTIQPT
jgi:hypothetical protein